METETQTQNNELVKVIETSGLDKTKAQVLLDKFTGYFEIASEWERKTKELIVNDISQVTEMKMAREARLFLSKKRIDVEKTRKALKEDSLREGQTIDAIAKILKNLIEPIENELEKKERFAEIKEAERKAELKAERTEKLLPYAVDTNIYPLGEMKQEAFDELYNGLKAAYDAKIEAEQKAEADRIEMARIKAIELENQRLENVKLKAEAEAKEKELEAERIKAKAIQDKAIADKAKADEEAKIKKELELKKKKAFNAPEREKLILLAKTIREIELPTVATDDAKIILKDVKKLIYKLSDFITEKSNSL